MDAVSAHYLHQKLLSGKEGLQLSSLLKYRLVVFTKKAKNRMKGDFRRHLFQS